MRAVGYRKSLPITDPEALVALDLPQPEPGPRDLLVKVAAVSVNPVDTKVRRRAEPGPRAAPRSWAGTRPAPLPAWARRFRAFPSATRCSTRAT